MGPKILIRTYFQKLLAVSSQHYYSFIRHREVEESPLFDLTTGNYKLLFIFFTEVLARTLHCILLLLLLIIYDGASLTSQNHCHPCPIVYTPDECEWRVVVMIMPAGDNS
jgi:hypothetical protein